ncbi:MAG TPA: hypothetical protein VHQ65_03845 [Thermoanaerobaculia bacterium]|nr:hypothetical protein [Thermoanaerobaculia bacterium]
MPLPNRSCHPRPLRNRSCALALAVLLTAPAAVGAPPRSETATAAAAAGSWRATAAAWLGELGALLGLAAGSTGGLVLLDESLPLAGDGDSDGDALTRSPDAHEKVGPTFDPNGTAVR